MSLSDIIDEENARVRLTFTDKMREAAKRVVFAAAKRHGGSPITRSTTGYELALDAFKEAVYEANPHLDPKAMRDSKGRPAYVMRLDMEANTGKRLNNLLRLVAAENGLEKAPAPFRENNARGRD